MRSLSKLLRWRRKETASAGNVGVNDIGLLSHGDNASITYLLDPYIASRGQAGVLLPADLAPPGDLDAFQCRTIVIVRYLPEHWTGFLRRFRAAGGSIVYFMDDDLMDPAATAGLPPAYAKKIYHGATRQRSKLEALCNEFWVASVYLADKYRAWSPVLLAPAPAASQIADISTTTVCYHGTASHQTELQWLVAIVKSVQAAGQPISFEVFGDHTINRMFRHLPKVSVLHPMSWSNYLAYTGTVSRDIALAPLLPVPFNAARGPTKFFDFARMGAVGIYTDVAPYRGFIRDGIDGVLLPNEPELWTDAISELVSDPSRRQQMAQAARKRALEMAWDMAERDKAF